MIKRAYMICSNEEVLKKELDHLRNVFTGINNYPQKLVEATMKRIKEEISAPQTTENNINDDQESTPTTLMIKVPFAGDKGEGLLKDLGVWLIVLSVVGPKNEKTYVFSQRTYVFSQKI